MSRALAARIRRLEKALVDSEQCETLEQIVRASLLRTEPLTEQQQAEIDADCIASLAEPNIPQGRPGWLYQLIMRARGGWLVAQGAALV